MQDIHDIHNIPSEKYILYKHSVKKMIEGKDDILDDIILLISYVLETVANDLISEHYKSPLRDKTLYRQLPDHLFTERANNLFDKDLFKQVVKSYIDYQYDITLNNEYTYNPYTMSNFNKHREYLTVIENILIENTI